MDLSASSLLSSMVLGSIGFGLFLYGKKQVRMPQLSVGLAMMVYPYFVSSPLAMWGVGLALLGTLILVVRAGH